MKYMLGQRIATQRKKLRISQTELARRLCISPSTVGMYEQGRREPSIDILIALSRELHVSTDFLLTGHNWFPNENAAAALLVCPDSKMTPYSKKYTVLSLSDEELTSAIASLLKEL